MKTFCFIFHECIERHEINLHWFDYYYYYYYSVEKIFFYMEEKNMNYSIFGTTLITKEIITKLLLQHEKILKSPFWYFI